MRLAQEKQKNGQKTLEQEIEEELSAKKTKNEKELLKEKEELYLKSLNSGRRKSKNTVVPNKPDHAASSSQSSSTSNQLKRPISDLQRKEETFRRDEAFRREDQNECRPEIKKRELPPISQTYRRETAPEPKESRPNLENILNQSKPGNLAAKISSLSKEELQVLAEAVKKVKKEKKSPKDEDEYSPRAAGRYNEYRPDEYRPDEYRPSKPKASSSFVKSEREPVYVPTKIKNGRKVEQEDEEYDPVTNYKVSKADMLSLSQRKPAGGAQSKLFDIDSLTPDEIEKIRKERAEKQKREAAASAPLPNRMPPPSSVPGKFKEPARPSHSSGPSHSGHSRATLDRPRSAYSGRDLPPIGATYRRGDYAASSDYYQNYYGDSDYDEEEDDDMRDFIDDGDYASMQQEDVSKTIRSLFPTRRARRPDPFSDDDVEEESSYERLMAEEARSARIAREEDAEEERKIREHKKRKEMLRRKGVSVSSDEDDSD